MIETALFAILKTASGFANSSSPLTYRIHALFIPQHAYDESTKLGCVVYTKDGVERQVKYEGTDDVCRASFQLDYYSRSHDDAIALAAAGRAVLLDYAGTIAGIRVKGAHITNEFSLVDPEPGLYRVTQFWSIWYLES